MSRYLGSVCKQCRREKEKLFLKGEKCIKKCTLEGKRGKNLPGQHGTNMRGKVSEYARHLREKQKARRIYGLTEEQFRHYFRRAERQKGLTGENLITMLELRLDNVLYRTGLATSRKAARQWVNHGNVLVNGRCINLPGYGCKVGDKVAIKDSMKENPIIKKAVESSDRFPAWMAVDKPSLCGTVSSMPSASGIAINSQLIVELYSK
jgi:small subunit ribosomal protein S4